MPSLDSDPVSVENSLAYAVLDSAVGCAEAAFDGNLVQFAPDTEAAPPRFLVSQPQAAALLLPKVEIPLRTRAALP